MFWGLLGDFCGNSVFPAFGIWGLGLGSPWYELSGTSVARFPGRSDCASKVEDHNSTVAMLCLHINWRQYEVHWNPGP